MSETNSKEEATQDAYISLSSLNVSESFISHKSSSLDGSLETSALPSSLPRGNNLSFSDSKTLDAPEGEQMDGVVQEIGVEDKSKETSIERDVDNSVNATSRSPKNDQ
ncbi:MAG: hypothetical protein AAGI44_03285, partial [Pseudomonadota bacterium]